MAISLRITMLLSRPSEMATFFFSMAGIRAQGLRRLKNCTQKGTRKTQPALESHRIACADLTSDRVGPRRSDSSRRPVGSAPLAFDTLVFPHIVGNSRRS